MTHFTKIFAICWSRSHTDRMQSHIVAPALLTDGGWKRFLGCSALLQGCDGHLITWLTEVIRHLHPTGVPARSWPPLPLSAPTLSWSRFMHMSIIRTPCYVLSFSSLLNVHYVLSLLLFRSQALSVKYTVWMTCFSAMWWKLKASNDRLLTVFPH